MTGRNPRFPLGSHLTYCYSQNRGNAPVCFKGSLGMSKPTLYLLLPVVRLLLRVGWDFFYYGARLVMHWAVQLKACNPLLLLGWMAVRADLFLPKQRRPYSVSNGSSDQHVAAVADPPRVENKQPILVTGSHRSGTTWVGHMIALAPNVHYIHEPAHPDHDRGICGAKFDFWYTYISTRNEQPYYRYLKRTINLRYSPIQKLRQTRRLRSVPGIVRECIHVERLRRRHPRVLIKGPFALFSIPWYVSRFDIGVVVMIRHPAAFASSLKIANWHFPFEHWVKQPLLMEEVLSRFSAEIERQAHQPGDVLDQATLLWKCIHHAILGYMVTNPEWMFIRHEDLSLDPVKGLRKIYQKLGLDFTESIQEKIAEHSASSNPVGGLDHRYEFKLNSRANLETWKQRLSEDEALRIRRQVEEVACFLYSPESWERSQAVPGRSCSGWTPRGGPNISRRTKA